MTVLGPDRRPPLAAPRRGGAARLARAALLALAAAAAGCGGGEPAYDAGIDGVYLVQSSQDYAGTVPLVQGRAGLLRVFLRAERAGLAAPAVRVRLHDASGALLQTYAATAQPAPPALPTAVSEASLGDSWNFAVPAADVQPGRYFVAEVDPIAGVPASRTKTSFRYPASGDLDVRAVPPVAITLVPVVQAPAGQPPLVPIVSGPEPGGGVRSVDGWLDRARRIHPLVADVQLGATYTTSTVLGADGTGWSSLLAELEQKRVMDGSASSYLGAVHVTYTAGTAGIAYAPSARRPASALAWDAGSTPDNPSYQKAAAHEVGHTLGLLHAPCGTPLPGGLDPRWPTGPTYTGAHIGVFGWDPLDGTVKDPAAIFDLMSYCGKLATTWTSDYDYRRVLTFLSSGTATAAAGAARSALALAPARQPCLVVAGHLREGLIELEPSYVVETIPSLLAPGEYALDLVDEAGATLASFPFAPTLVAAEREGEVEERHFALAVPLSAGWADGVRGLAVRERGAAIQRRALAGPPAVERPAPAARAASRRHAQVSWDARAHPGAMVRDPRTGEVIALLRGGSGVVQTDAPELEVVLSDGVGARRRVVVAP